MNRKEFYEKYGHVKVKFSSYYKYTFIFCAALDEGLKISCGYGGGHDEIYRFELNHDMEERISQLEPYCGYVVNMEGVTVDEFYDY